MYGLKILSAGAYIPKHLVTNHDMSKMVDTSDEWIQTRTGIKQRYIAKQETNAYMAYMAAKQAVENIDKSKIVAVVVATYTPDNYTPSIASTLQKSLGLSHNIIAIDVNAACTGFVYALQVANGLCEINDGYALVVGSDKNSKIIDFTDRSTCILFGDGAGATVVALDEKTKANYINGTISDDNAIVCSADKTKSQFMQMAGNDVFRFATMALGKCVDKILKKCDYQLNDVDMIICHQANKRILDHVIKKMQIPTEKMFINLDKYGNTSAASMPIALYEALTQNQLTSNQKVLLAGFGSGLTYGSTIVTIN